LDRGGGRVSPYEEGHHASEPQGEVSIRDDGPNTSDERLLDLARRMLGGEAVDWAREGIAESEVRRGLERLQLLLRDVPTDTEEASRPEPPPLPPPPPPPKREREDRYLGDFRLVRTLGEGGMGLVYEAEQQHPRRPVALKVVRGGAHVSPDTLKLFQREAQTLARLRHPGIAQLYETGATEDGLHFFAMELVRGETLAEWLRKRPAGPVSPAELRLRLGLFRKICDAVAYAHQKGVIHRDLKPANVLIPKVPLGSSLPDAIPDVKILDFGLARMTDSDVQASTYVTEMGRVQGTLPYMSPEQVRGNPDEIDLRTDVYSLGVMLYEMVAGRLPYDFSRAQLPEAVRIICHEPPRSISATFSGTRRLDADVITIAGKCLEKEPQRRYQSAAALGEDVGRWLTDQPILARPPSAAYQLKKLVARHRGPFAFAATVFVLVTVLAVTSTIQALRISAERDRANEEAETAKQVSEFLEGLFKISDPSESRGRTITARQLLDDGAGRIERELEDQPRARARLLATIANTYLGLGLLPDARRLFDAALEAHGAAFGADSVEYATVLTDIGVERFADGAVAQSMETARRALSILEAALPPDDSRRLKAMWLLGICQMHSGRLEDAERNFRGGLKLLDASRTPDDRLRIWFLNDLSTTARASGRLEEARRLIEEAQRVRERLYPELHPERINGLNNVGYVLMHQGDLAGARALFERCVRDGATVYGEDHPNVLNWLHSLGEVQRRMGDLAQARRTFERCLDLLGSPQARRSPAAALSLTGIAQIDEAEGRWADAEGHARETIDLVTGSLGFEHPGQAEAHAVLARVLRHQGRITEATRADARVAELRVKSGWVASYDYSFNAPFTRVEAGVRP
jgi:serine/threonine protein kinase/Tfp pilus assembly protein PilF